MAFFISSVVEENYISIRNEIFDDNAGQAHWCQSRYSEHPITRRRTIVDHATASLPLPWT
jgi:hypothetical protein